MDTPSDRISKKQKAHAIKAVNNPSRLTAPVYAGVAGALGFFGLLYAQSNTRSKEGIIAEHITLTGWQPRGKKAVRRDSLGIYVNASPMTSEEPAHAIEISGETHQLLKNTFKSLAEKYAKEGFKLKGRPVIAWDIAIGVSRDSVGVSNELATVKNLRDEREIAGALNITLNGDPEQVLYMIDIKTQAPFSIPITVENKDYGAFLIETLKHNSITRVQSLSPARESSLTRKDSHTKAIKDSHHPKPQR